MVVGAWRGASAIFFLPCKAKTLMMDILIKGASLTPSSQPFSPELKGEGL